MLLFSFTGIAGCNKLLQEKQYEMHNMHEKACAVLTMLWVQLAVFKLTIALYSAKNVTLTHKFGHFSSIFIASTPHIDYITGMFRMCRIS